MSCVGKVTRESHIAITSFQKNSIRMNSDNLNLFIWGNKPEKVQAQLLNTAINSKSSLMNT